MLKSVKNIFNRSNITKRSVNKLTDKTLPVLLREPKVLLIGGGKVAFQKAKVLKDNKIEFSIISIELCNEIKELNVDFSLRKFSAGEIKGFNVIVDATGNPEVCELLIRLKKKKNFLLNCVDIPDKCDFYFSSLLLYKNLKVAVSSDGGSPALTQVVRDKIKNIIPGKIGDLAEKKYNERIRNIIDVESTKNEAYKLFGKVFLVGCGPGSEELLTIKALKIIQSADVILHDNLVSPEILKNAKPDAQIFCVGKEKGNHLFNQDEINKIMAEYAKAGSIVARLKGGDPYIFGRGAEEAAFLIENNINVEVTPGISSAFAAPLLAGIPSTCRDYSSAVSVVSAYKKDDASGPDWINFLKLKNHTTIVLMGLSKVEEIFYRGVQSGVDTDLPAAIISNASTDKQKILISTFKNLIEISKEAEKPAVLVFGEVVNLSEKLYKEKFSENVLC